MAKPRRISPKLVDPDLLKWLIDNLPSVLLGYQQRWLKDRSGFKVYVKSRRIGISWAEAGDCALESAEAQGGDCFYIAYEKDMTRGFIEDCAEFAKAYGIVASQIEEDVETWRDGDEDKSVQVFRLHFNSGYKIEALSSQPRNMRSRQGRVVIDEAAFHDDLPGLLKAAKALRIWGSRIHIISTYDGVDNAFYELEQEVFEGKLPYSRHFTTFDDALVDGLYKRICLIKKREWSPEIEAEWRAQTMAEFGEDANEELLCIPSNSGGAYIPSSLIRARMVLDTPVIQLHCREGYNLVPVEQRTREIQEWLEDHVKPLLQALNPHLQHSYGQDFARKSDLSVIVVIQEQLNLVKHWALTVEMRNVPYEQQKQVLFYVVDRLPRFAAGKHDAGGNGGSQAEAAQDKYGVTQIEAIQLSAGWYKDHMPRYKAAFEDGTLLLPANEDLRKDHQAIEVINGVPLVPQDKRTIGADGKPRHGDAAIAGCLAFAASEADPVPVEHQALEGVTVAAELAGFVGGGGGNFRGWQL